MYYCLDSFWTCRDLRPAGRVKFRRPWVPNMGSQNGPGYPNLGPMCPNLGSMYPNLGPMYQEPLQRLQETPRKDTVPEPVWHPRRSPGGSKTT